MRNPEDNRKLKTKGDPKMKKHLHNLIVSVILLMSLALTASAAYPEKIINIIVPFDPGGAVDVTVRFLVEYAEKELGGKIVVQNKPGGGAVIGQTFVAQAAPDGYTLLAMTSSAVTNPMTKETTFTHKSFTPIALYCFDPEVVVVPAKSPYQTFQQLIEAAKKKSLIMGTPGHSTSHHVAGLMLEKATGAKFEYVHNNGAPAQVLQLLGGYTEVGLMAYGECMSQVKEGKLRILAVASEERSEVLPNVPTMRETGIDLVYGAWRGIAAPANLPADILEKLSTAFTKAIANPGFKEKMDKAGYPVLNRDAKGFKEYIEKDAAAVLEIFKELGIVK